jgi:predicted dehydrogenase
MSAGQLRGAGRVSYFQMKAWKQISQASIVAIADPDKDVAIQRGEQFGIPHQHIYASFEEWKMGD